MQYKANKNIQTDKVLLLTKNNGELQKQFNRSQRNVEILQQELLQIQAMLEAKKTAEPKVENNIDNYFN